MSDFSTDWEYEIIGSDHDGYVACLRGVRGGPIVSGRNKTDALANLREAFLMYAGVMMLMYPADCMNESFAHAAVKFADSILQPQTPTAISDATPKPGFNPEND